MFIQHEPANHDGAIKNVYIWHVLQNIVEVYEHTLHLGYAMQIYIHCSVSVGDVIESLWLGLFDLNGNFVVITIRNTPGTKLPAMCDIGNV